MFCPAQPIAQHFEEPLSLYFWWRFHILRKGPHSLLVGFEKQSVLALEMLEDRTLGDAQFRGNILDARRAVPMLGEVTNGHLHDPGPLGLPSRTRFPVRPQLRGLGQTAGHSIHA